MNQIKLRIYNNNACKPMNQEQIYSGELFVFLTVRYGYKYIRVINHVRAMSRRQICDRLE